MKYNRSMLWMAVAILFVSAVMAQAGEEADAILEAAGSEGGLIVHVGCGDGVLTAELRTGDNYIVQGLDRSAANIEKARDHIRSLGLYGVVSANRFDGKHLPYVDNLVNLVVAEDLGGVPLDEIMRVLAPLGIAYFKNGETWRITRKPWPEDIDEWQQHFHDADNNPVANDRVVGPPRRLQWTGEPRWGRSHLGLPSVNSMVSSKGRLFNIEDLVSAEYPALPGKYALVARDAFNGLVLWHHPFAVWQSVGRQIKATPIQLQRRLAAIGDTVYCTPGFDRPITAFEASTGRILKTYEGTEATQEFVFDRDILYVVSGDPMNSYGLEENEHQRFLGTAFDLSEYGPESRNKPNPKCSIFAIEADSGRRIWEVSSPETTGYQGGTLAVKEESVVYSTETLVICLDRTTGNKRWQMPIEHTIQMGLGIGNHGAAPSLLLSKEAVYVADNNTITAFSLKDGTQLWEGKAKATPRKGSDLFIRGGAVWSLNLQGYDPLSGEVVDTLSQAMLGPMAHARCYRNRVTENYYLNSETGGTDFLVFGAKSNAEFPNPWVRGTCGIGILPCNGLLYAPPAACSCSNWAKLHGFNALAPEPNLESSGQPIKVEAVPRLEEGSAYGTRLDHTPLSPGSWPTYRHDPERTGSSKSEAPGNLDICWQTKVSTLASAPTIAGGKVFVADIDAHTVRAFDADDGTPLWSYTTGARVDSPPTIYKGLVLFGSRDGWVYCLKATDGTLVWRFCGLPQDRWITAFGQLESAWPVNGSVLVKNDVVYFAAGRNSFLDGGIWLFGLDPESGRVIHENHLYGPFGDDAFPMIIPPEYKTGTGIRGFKNDVFVSHGDNLFLRHQGFRPDLTPIDIADIHDPHLIASAGLLEPVPHHRSWWTINTRLKMSPSISDNMTGGKATGDILVMDGNRFIEIVGYSPSRSKNFDARINGYTLRSDVMPQRATPETSQGGGEASTWSRGIPLTGKAMALAGNSLFIAGTPLVFPEGDLHRSFEGRMGGIAWAVSAQTGEKIGETELRAAPAWDGMAVADGRLYISLQDGTIACLGSNGTKR